MPTIIQSLAERAGFIYWHGDQKKRHTSEIDWSSDYTEELERFADLIVKECTTIVSNAVEHRVPASEYVQLIKNRFLVK